MHVKARVEKMRADDETRAVDERRSHGRCCGCASVSKPDAPALIDAKFGSCDREKTHERRMLLILLERVMCAVCVEQVWNRALMRGS